MSIDDAVKLTDALARLITALIWPCVIAYIFIRFGPALREFVASLGELSVKGAGFEATAKRKAEAAAALAAAVVSRAQTPATPESVIQETRTERTGPPVEECACMRLHDHRELAAHD